MKKRLMIAFIIVIVIGSLITFICDMLLTSGFFAFFCGYAVSKLEDLEDDI